MSNHYHRFHLVNPSPWPLLVSICALTLTVNTAFYFHNVKGCGYFLFIGLVGIIYFSGCWWRDVIREATFEGHHTLEVQQGLRIGFYLFIVSEIMFFFSFFWAFLHSSLSPSIWIGCYWPPIGIQVLDPYGLPLLNTALLLWSGVTVTYCHHAIRHNAYQDARLGFLKTIAAALLFTFFQFIEYVGANFDISDGIYGSCFYMLTGFHGFHVIIGTLFLLVCYYRHLQFHFTPQHHLGLEFAIWYWHFVDVVWILLYILVYCWGNSSQYL